MSIADRFDHAPDTGYVRDYDPNAARRQFNMSMILIVIVAAAAAALSVIVRFDAPASPMYQGRSVATSADAPVAPPAYAGKL